MWLFATGLIVYCAAGTLCAARQYDIRFPQYAHLLRLAGAHLLLYPGAFNMTTGPIHWELLAKARAVDNQAFVAVPSPARNPSAGYQAWGHSSVVDPWGKVTERRPRVARDWHAHNLLRPRLH